MVCIGFCLGILYVVNIVLTRFSIVYSTSQGMASHSHLFSINDIMQRFFCAVEESQFVVLFARLLCLGTKEYLDMSFRLIISFSYCKVQRRWEAFNFTPVTNIDFLRNLQRLNNIDG